MIQFDEHYRFFKWVVEKAPTIDGEEVNNPIALGHFFGRCTESRWAYRLAEGKKQFVSGELRFVCQILLGNPLKLQLENAWLWSKKQR